MSELNKIYLYRMTHIDNIPHILQFGITHSTSDNANPDFKPIGDHSLISTRSEYELNNRRLLGEYIPFYFANRTPMLFVIQRGHNNVPLTPPENIVYCVSSVQKILDLNLDFVFTNGHAVDKFSSQYTRLAIDDLETIIDRKAINAKYWHDENDLDLKRRKEAEFLVLGDISITAVLGYVVYNENARQKLISFGIDEAKIVVKSTYYF